MDKGSLKRIFTLNTSHRVSKLTTLSVATCMLVTMIAVDASANASASPKTVPSITRPTGNSPAFAVESSLNKLFGFGRRHAPQKPSLPVSTSGSTTTTNPTSTSGTGSGGSNSTPPSSGTPSPTTTIPPTTTTTSPTTTTTEPTSGAFPTGVADGSSVSGYDPPGANALGGYSQSYVTTFPGTSLPSGWDVYSGGQGGDPGGQWGGNSHVVVGGGMLSLNTFQDPNYGNEWVAGGLCQCGKSQTYGAYFVRSRVTGAGPTAVELLWPTVGWPPEIDFNETSGTTTETTATNIWALNASGSKEQVQVAHSIDMTQWNTFGVVWTPSSITYTVNGQVWGTFTNASEIPDQPMTLDLQQQTWCSSNWACPTTPQSMQIAWVAEYSPNS
jgi:beta-glucanase (GH16 family)